MRKLLNLLLPLLVISSAIAGEDNPSPENSGGNPETQEPAVITGRMWVSGVSGNFVGDTGTFTFQINVEVENINPPYGTKWSGFSNAFALSSPDGAGWTNVQGFNSPALTEGWDGSIAVTTWSDDISSDTVAFKTTGEPKKFLDPGTYDDAFSVSVLLNRSDRGKSICLDSISVPPTYQWSWGTGTAAVYRPRWGGQFCFTVSAPFEIEASAGPNGTITPSGTVQVAQGANQSFAISPDEGYHVSDLFVDGSSVGPMTDYTFTDVQANHSIVATFVIDTLTISASASANGEISPSGNLTAIYGTDLSFTMTPTGEGYLVDLFVDGQSVGQQSSYTFTNITANHTIFALFNDSTFVPTQQYSADIMFLQTTDLDQDNYTDIVYSSSGSAPADVAGLWVAYGLPGGTFETPVKILGARRTPIAFGFINADTVIDLVTVGGIDGQQVYRVFYNLDRTFSVDSQSYAGAIANSIVAGYFNSDSYIDFLLGNGTIIYGGIVTSAGNAQIAIDAVSLNVGDFNLDGISDLAAGEGDSIKILLSDGAGTFTQSAAIFTGHNLSPIPPVRSVADIDNDGKLDIASVVLTEETPESKSLLVVGFGDGAGGFRSVFTQDLDGYAVNAQIADVDRDHHLDIISSCGTNPEQRVIVLYGDGAGNFPHISETSYPTAPGSTLAIGTGDLDRDGNPDFVTGGYQGPAPITVMYSTPPDANVLNDEMVVTVYSGVTGPFAHRNRAGSGTPEVTLGVTNPENFEISKTASTVSGSFYWQLDADNNLIADNRTIDYNLAEGEYTIVVYAVPGVTEPTYAVVVGIDGSQQSTIATGTDELGGSNAVASGVDSVVYYFRVEAIPAIDPQSGEPTPNAQPIVSWPHLLPPGSPTTTYDFQLSEYTDFRTLTDEASGLPSTKYLVAHKLPRNKVYFWRVRQVDEVGQNVNVGDWSHHYSLYIAPGCCAGITGNVDCDPQDLVDIADLAMLIDHMFISMQPLCCDDEANVDGLAGIDVTDLSDLIANLYFEPEYHTIVNCPQ